MYQSIDGTTMTCFDISSLWGNRAQTALLLPCMMSRGMGLADFSASE